ncbi:MAG TPA: sulfite exporter TauE/SafE family protein, partial [Thermoplasmata archaeon]|nr:sulfite exporter TauE/SafE family protein [Thermoplasmata archaeon]
AAVLAPILPERVLSILFGVLLLVSLIPIFAKFGQELPRNVTNDRLANALHLNSRYYDKHLGREVAYNVTGVPAALGIMAFAGIISGVLGIGAGVVKVLAHEIAMKVPTKVSTATSNFMIGVTAAAGAGVLLAAGYVNPLVAAPVAIGTAAGAYLGSRILPDLANRTVRLVFLPVLVLLAIEVILRGLGLP